MRGAALAWTLPTLVALGCSGAAPSRAESDQAALGVRASAQLPIMDGPNVYSPELVKTPTGLRMYFGGWREASQRHDDIYVADCPAPLRPCENVRTVLHSPALGFEHLNDPSIVVHPGGYFVMYMTGVRAGDNALVASNNNVYYATSWLDDGVNWSTPTLLLAHHWLPSATIKGEQIELYANDNAIHGGVVRFSLGPSGVVPNAPTTIETSSGALYANVHVLWRPTANAYHMLGERAAGVASSVVDLLSSVDGLRWNVVHESVVSPSAGEIRVGTPAQHPDELERVYFATTKSRNSTGFSIKTSTWSVP